MVRYQNPNGFNFGPVNHDGYGISFIVVAVSYSLCFYSSCIFLWVFRRHPVVKMRNICLMLLSVLVLHVFLIPVFVSYTLNGADPCQVEFWIMSIYLPIGIGLFQAQNLQLLIVSRQQVRMNVTNQCYKSLLPKMGPGLICPKYWLFRLKHWWKGMKDESQYKAYISLGFIVQVRKAQVLYLRPQFVR